ncbi:hypothetical protein A3C59_04760 [Candidatus Daviesbacteria bacterium RIFCSPHIGHO2_02_FULL_36_13]|uniref:Glycosyltransferase RgtA/B/C/D-like domain-containing protein n=1 Tax=Candidatus Daviesbacteria bacterium RIFCSPHIGHO2_02_FULL_36_13 TaxID=1797768 RepID=A0A1F5JNL4_9BACT|nr:MAG: hypothetical protein A3C59_04760 [Candidatus Daviesbacteria bacterium RIFCSPHIGHO2_02_FULL_36_13]
MSILRKFFLLGLIILLAFVLRLWKIDSPIADWHSWRQADTAAVTRNFIKHGFNPFLPKFDDMSAISEFPVANPLGFRFVEFPVYNIFVYPFYLFFGIEDMYHRLVSVFFSLGSTAVLYFLVKKYWDQTTAFLSALTFAILPYNVFFSRTTLPEPTFVFFSLSMMFFSSEWIEKNTKINLILAFVFTSIAFLIKPWAIFFYLPLLYLSLKKKALKRFLIFSCLAFLPFIFWRLWILQQPEGIPASSWLLNSDGIRFRPAFWWWIVSERMGREILGATGLVLFTLGLILKPKNGNYFFHFWALSIFLYFAIFATGNVRHDYYQVLFVPVAAVLLSAGFLKLTRGENNFVPRIFTISLALILYTLSIYFGYKEVKGLYQINNPVIVEAGKKADEILPKDAIVLAPYNGDSAFLYQTNRKGFPFVPTSIKDLIADFGVSYYISPNYDDKTNWVLRHFYAIEENPKFVIVDLTKVKKDFNDKDLEP